MRTYASTDNTTRFKIQKEALLLRRSVIGGKTQQYLFGLLYFKSLPTTLFYVSMQI